jgi:hypothetical protein
MRLNTYALHSHNLLPALDQNWRVKLNPRVYRITLVNQSKITTNVSGYTSTNFSGSVATNQHKLLTGFKFRVGDSA